VSVLAIALLVISVFWSFRVRAAQEASQFEPARGNTAIIPAGTVINGILRNGIPASVAAGDTITANTDTPLMLDNRVAIPAGVQLAGTVEDLSFSGRTATADIRFTALFTGRRSIPIQTEQIIVTARVQSSIEAVSGGLSALIGTGIGAGIGAASGDVKLVKRGVLEGAGSMQVSDSSIPISITLTRDLAI
jgi:hypothetical protein